MQKPFEKLTIRPLARTAYETLRRFGTVTMGVLFSFFFAFASSSAPPHLRGRRHRRRRCNNGHRLAFNDARKTGNAAPFRSSRRLTEPGRRETARGRRRGSTSLCFDARLEAIYSGHKPLVGIKPTVRFVAYTALGLGFWELD